MAWKKKIKFDLIFADPPYQSNLQIRLLNEISENDLLLKNGKLILEHQSNQAITTTFANLFLHKAKISGNTAVSFFTKIG